VTPHATSRYARRIRRAAARRRARLLCLHGYMQPETFVEEPALLTTMALQFNVEVIQMQLPYHGRRAPRGFAFLRRSEPAHRDEASVGQGPAAHRVA
jgi:hypothetical protein